MMLALAILLIFLAPLMMLPIAARKSLSAPMLDRLPMGLADALATMLVRTINQ